MAYAASLGAAVAAFDARDFANAADVADVIFKNGTIIPMDAQGSAEALAIGGGKILAAGTTEQVSRLLAAPHEISTSRAARFCPD